MTKIKVKSTVLTGWQKTLLIGGFYLLVCSGVRASGEPFPIGARSWGLANATAAMADKQSVFNNPAGVGFLTENFVHTAYHSRFNLAGLQTFALGANYVHRLVNTGITVERFGDKLYHEQKLGLVFAKSIDRVALGIKVSYSQAVVENLSSKHTFVTEFGVISKLSPKVQLGFNAYNLTRAQLYISQRIPTVLRLGLAFQPSGQLLLVAEAEKDLDFPTLIKMGLEYQLVRNFYIRTGLTSKINDVHLGFGIKAKQFFFDYAMSNHSMLGFSQHFTLAYQLNKTKPDTKL
ncbi:hypothetical protein [Emticicia sp. 17c]|uniref:hypothetical protein n=1 Tax=Emticicia sp. 17c TaxID=3127704 RepID=UPI00301C7741